MLGEYSLDTSLQSPATRKANRKGYGRKTVIPAMKEATQTAIVKTRGLVSLSDQEIESLLLPGKWFDENGGKIVALLIHRIGYEDIKCDYSTLQDLKTRILFNIPRKYDYKSLTELKYIVGNSYNNWKGSTVEYTDLEKLEHKNNYDRNYRLSLEQYNEYISQFYTEYVRIFYIIVDILKEIYEHTDNIQFMKNIDEFLSFNVMAIDAAKSAFNGALI